MNHKTKTIHQTTSATFLFITIRKWNKKGCSQNTEGIQLLALEPAHILTCCFYRKDKIKILAFGDNNLFLEISSTSIHLIRPELLQKIMFAIIFIHCNICFSFRFGIQQNFRIYRKTIISSPNLGTISTPCEIHMFIPCGSEWVKVLQRTYRSKGAYSSSNHRRTLNLRLRVNWLFNCTITRSCHSKQEQRWIQRKKYPVHCIFVLEHWSGNVSDYYDK